MQQTYDPNKVILTFGTNTITQFAKGTFITVSRDSAAFSDDVGANGDVVRVKSADKRGTIKFTLMAASPSNDTLTDLAINDELGPTTTFPVQIKDMHGTSSHFAESAWIKQIPQKQYGTEASHVEWEIRCSALGHYLGGTEAI